MLLISYAITDDVINSISEVDSAADSLAEGASLVVADSSEAGNSSEAAGSLAVAGSSAADDSLDKHSHHCHTIKIGSRFTKQ